MNFNWKDVGSSVIQAGAPILGGALMGPAGAAVGTLIANQFAVKDATPENIISAISNDPNAAIKLREIELNHIERLSELDNERFRIETTDVQNARAEHKHHWMPSVITLFLTAIFGAIIGALFIWAIPTDNKDIITYMSGQVSGMLTSCVAYWVSSTRSSANKDLMRK